MGDTNLGNMFAGFAKAATKFGSQAAKSAASSAAMIKETVTAQSRIHMDYEVAAEVGQCGPEGVWKVHRARPIKSGEHLHPFPTIMLYPSLCCECLASFPPSSLRTKRCGTQHIIAVHTCVVSMQEL